MKNLEQRYRIIELRAHSMQYIAQELDLSKQTVINRVKELYREIQDLRALSLESLYEQHLMSDRARIKLLSKQLSKVRAELAKRKFEDVSTEKLFDMQLKLLANMKQEKEKLVLTEESNSSDFRRMITSEGSWSSDN